MREPTVASVMTKEVVTARPDTTFKEIAELLAGKGISAVPVVDGGGTPIGVVSEADLLAKQEYRAGGRQAPGLFAARARKARWRKSFGAVASHVMSKPPIVVDPGTPVSEAARLLADANVRRLFVVDRTGVLVGVLARRDLVRLYLRDDDELREDIRQVVFRKVLWIDPDTVDVAVDEGQVTLSGELDRRSEVDLAIRLTRVLPGVVDVRSELGYGFDDETPS
jgi:CBS domain-containing protein